MNYSDIFVLFVAFCSTSDRFWAMASLLLGFCDGLVFIRQGHQSYAQFPSWRAWVSFIWHLAQNLSGWPKAARLQPA